MIKVQIKQGDNALKFSFPESWHELTFKQLHEIMCLRETNSATNYELVRVILGLSKSDFEKLPIDFYLSLERVMLLWISQEIDLQNKELPDVFWINEKAVILPKNIGELSIAQYKDSQQLFIDLQELVDKQDRAILESEMLNLYPTLLATYLQPILGGKEYDYKEADFIAKYVWDCKGLDVMAFANFFFHKAQVLRSGTQKGVQKFLIQGSKFKRAMKILRRVAALFLPLRS